MKLKEITMKCFVFRKLKTSNRCSYHYSIKTVVKLMTSHFSSLAQIENRKVICGSRPLFALASCQPSFGETSRRPQVFFMVKLVSVPVVTLTFKTASFYSYVLAQLATCSINNVCVVHIVSSFMFNLKKVFPNYNILHNTSTTLFSH